MLRFVDETLSQEDCGCIAALSVGSCGRSLGEWVGEAVACIERHAVQIEDPACVEAFVESLRSDYDMLFQVPGELYVHPWESPHIGKESMVFQESTLDVRSFYRNAGFKLQTEGSFPDDHIAAMMDYMGRMGHRAYEAYADGCDEDAVQVLAEQRRFLISHITTWVDQFANTVIENDEHACYGALAGAMAAFAHLDEVLLTRVERELAG
ncbi:molecular chaperone [Paraeggerthella sp. Marseille-Q4926]|uniref:TorD/DmsD family molecular chaperone n=1 Tax=Paraeggerthella sp. Marseille-Q4926 TaxID=2866587 RepID=UPI001CE4043C|nr:molecular chaperone TorD family protein [Paraeggerthella sp. Marseille-Q4926]